jgi:hypothetical protein
MNGLNEFYHNIKLGNAHLRGYDEITSYGPFEFQIKLIFKTDSENEGIKCTKQIYHMHHDGPTIVLVIVEEFDLLRFKLVFQTKEMVFNVFLFNYEQKLSMEISFS